ncbi:hypothetical protein N5T98_03090 [Aliarcobacter cryaerophilus]|uniref:hypothetical protein n=1 Tax=Aliarcobacter cryaerophilus TaxID=28198 RepID=UPI0021B4D8E6|nr:hypothetical protein [Aliarcobacter cryaerophilus]MCT7485765.1 hypothetical protein [Aliarcobacter cryaerophilus]MCT7490077.1 hypothetical protein [Aliarcobacter cryaerophilus]
MKIKNYIKNAEELYYDKKLKQLQYEKTIIFKSKKGIYTLEEVNDYKEKTKSALIENEINSIYRLLDKKIAIFKTTTLNSNYNLSTEQSNPKEIDKQLKIQYKQLKNYHQFKNQFKADGKRLENQSVKIYDLTEALNIHTHSIDILKSKEDLEHYIKSVIYAKKKFDIGRIELCITKYTLQHIKKLFKDFKIRVKNRYLTLNLRTEKSIYIIEEQGKIEEGSYIYFKLLDNKKNSKKNMIRYFYKNILQERYTKTPTEEHTIFSKLGIRIKQFTKDYFNRKVQKHILYRTNNKLFLMIKRNNEDIQLSPTIKDLKSFLFYTASLFRKSILFLFDKQFVFYSKNKNPSTKWVQIVDLKTYEKEGYEECLNNNDIQITKIKDNNLLYFYQELEVKNIFIKGKFIDEFEKKEFFEKDKISQVWKEYLMMLYYERSKINIHKYMEEIISDYCEINSCKINVYKKF